MRTLKNASKISNLCTTHQNPVAAPRIPPKRKTTTTTPPAAKAQCGAHETTEGPTKKSPQTRIPQIQSKAKGKRRAGRARHGNKHLSRKKKGRPSQQTSLLRQIGDARMAGATLAERARKAGATPCAQYWVPRLTHRFTHRTASGSKLPSTALCTQPPPHHLEQHP